MDLPAFRIVQSHEATQREAQTRHLPAGEPVRADDPKRIFPRVEGRDRVINGLSRRMPIPSRICLASRSSSDRFFRLKGPMAGGMIWTRATGKLGGMNSAIANTATSYRSSRDG